MEAQAWRAALIVIALFLAATVVLDIRARMWLDEIFTYYIVHQPTTGDMIQALKEGCDGQPPLYALIVRALSPVFGAGPLGLRLPSTIGVCIMGLCIFAFTLRRFSALYAMVAMLLALNEMRYFASEARAYGLASGCAGVALLCWQRVTESRRRWLAIAGFSLSMACGIALHYYTIFLLLPLGLAELVRSRRRGKIDLAVLGAMAISPLVLLAHRPFIEAAKPFMAYYWAKNSSGVVGDMYWTYFFRYALALLFPAMLFFIWQYRPVSAPAETGQRFGMRLEEWIVVSALALAPAVVAFLSRVMVGYFVDRYAAWSVIGFSILATAILFRTVRGDAIAAALSVTILAAIMAGKIAVNIGHPDRLAEVINANAELLRVPASSLPIVIADAKTFVELSLYSDPKFQTRLVYPLKLELDQFYTNVDTTPRLLSLLRHRATIRVPDYDDFVKSNPHFLLLANTQDWLVWHLMMSGFRVTPLPRRWPPAVFDVTSVQP